MTDDKSLPKEERKRLQIAKTGKSARAKDPENRRQDLQSARPGLHAAGGMDRDAARRLCRGAADVVRSCRRGLNAALDEAFDAAHAEAARRYGR